MFVSCFEFVLGREYLFLKNHDRGWFINSIRPLEALGVGLELSPDLSNFPALLFKKFRFWITKSEVSTIPSFFFVSRRDMT